MKNLSIMLKPASSLCNLRCKYCFYADVANLREVKSFGIMSSETMHGILDQLYTALEPGDKINFAFQGGEPTMAGLAFFKHFTAAVDAWDKKITVTYALQTNATLLDDDWCALFAKYHFLLGVSCDILPEYHDAARVDAQNSGTYETVQKALRLLEQHHIEYNVLCTLTNSIARHPQQVWNQLEKLDIRYVQFTPCLGELGSSAKSVYPLTPDRFAAFYTQLFRPWYAAYTAGGYRSVKLFDDIVNLLAFGLPTACGITGQCQPQLVVEADGSTYPCDFYCLDAYRLGNAAQTPLPQLLASEQSAAFAARPHTQPALCAGCEYRPFCGGGCKRMQKEICCAPNGKTCGYRTLLKAVLPTLTQIARNEAAARRAP